MIDYLCATRGFTREAAYVLASGRGELRIAEVVDFSNALVDFSNALVSAGLPGNLRRL